MLIRPARPDGATVVAGLAGELAQSFAFAPEAFARHYPALLASDDACVLVADTGTGGLAGYLLGFRHLTFYAGGPVGWVEEVLVRAGERGSGTGRALMTEFERWARDRDCALVALATRRAPDFYAALGYEPSATYFRKVLREPPAAS